MNIKKSLDFPIGFPDSQIISFKSEKNNLLIFLEAWNTKILKFNFIENIFFLILNSWDISDICQIDDSPSLEKALKMVYEKMPLQHPYKVFQFFDNDDNTVVEVCSKDLIISVEPSYQL